MNIAKIAAHRASAGERVLVLVQRLIDIENKFRVITHCLPREPEHITSANGRAQIRYDNGGQITFLSKAQIRGMKIEGLDYLVLDDHEPLLDPHTAWQIFDMFSEKRPRIAVIG